MSGLPNLHSGGTIAWDGETEKDLCTILVNKQGMHTKIETRVVCVEDVRKWVGSREM